MSNKSDFEKAFPHSRQEGGNHYFFQGNVIKYVVRYKDKNGIEDLKKIIHYCQLEIEEMRDDPSA
jgi:hypothetical protein